MESRYKTASTLQQMVKPPLERLQCQHCLRNSQCYPVYPNGSRGKLSEEEAVVEILVETASSAADSAVKAGSVVGAQSLLVRYGSEKVLIDTLSKQGLKSSQKRMPLP